MFQIILAPNWIQLDEEQHQMGLVLIKLVPLPESPGFQPFHKSSFNTALKCVLAKN